MANHRDRRYLDLAHRVTECQCCGRSAPEGCEPAHSNQGEHGKGMSIKAHDVFHAAMAHDCHARLDQGNDETREEKMERWQKAFERTLLLYFRNGWLKVSK
jgi:hypothetical protein